MLRFATWKIVSIIAMILLAVLIVVPSLLPASTRASLDSALPSWARPRTLTLGLDLQGGSHVLLQVDGTDVVKTMVSNLRDDVRRILREERVALAGGISVQPRGVQLRVADPSEREKVLSRLRTLANPQASILGSSGAPFGFVTPQAVHCAVGRRLTRRTGERSCCAPGDPRCVSSR